MGFSFLQHATKQAALYATAYPSVGPTVRPFVCPSHSGTV